MLQTDRKKKFVDSQVQGKLVRRLVLHWLTFFMAGSVLAFCLQVLTNPFLSIGEQFQQMWWTHGPFLLVMLFLLPVFVLDTIRLSHRFAGPIYRLRQTIHNIACGDPPPRLKFRDFDFWQGLAEDFNRMVDRLKSQDTEVHYDEPADAELVEAN
ncbi:MAG: hypothetical protein MI725_03440 [Pirellulales bacterium]|nr:hypothetical protein [Pirellulales bacterium]